MTPQSRDTAPEIERILIEGLRRMSTVRKMQLVAEMYTSVKMLALAGLRERYPNDTDGQRRRRLADILLGEELARDVYGPGPE